MQEDFVLQTRHLKKYFGPVHAVEDVSLRVRRGEIFGFLGPNGAGKTTTISMLLGLTHADAGQVEIFGQRITPGHNRVLRKVGTMVGMPSLMQPFTARQNLQCMAHLYPDLSARHIDNLLERVGLKEAAHRKAYTFSTGMKQRLGLALALLGDPQLLILDEPTNGMDPAGMHEIRVLLRELAAAGTTVFLSSHLLHEMELTCDRVAVVNQGRVITEGSVQNLLSTQNVVRVHSADLAQTAQTLQELTGVHNIKVDGDFIDVQGVSSEAVMYHLIKHGITPKEVSMVHPDLESVFLELTRQPV